MTERGGARVLLLLFACVLRSGTGPETAQDRALAEAEARWANRAQPGELDAAVELWRGVIGADPDHPVALARLARAEWTRGELDREATIAHEEAAQDYGWRCLVAWPAFAAALSADAYRVTPESAAELPASAAPCVLWTAIGGLALAGNRGVGASLELGDVAVLLARLDAVQAEIPPETPLDPGFAAWARARLLVLEAAPEPPPSAARAAFAEAIAAAPEVLLFRRDYARAFPDARDVAFAGAPTGAGPWGLENEAWGE